MIFCIFFAPHYGLIKKTASMKHLAIGIDLGGTNLKGVIMEQDGACRHLTRVPTEADKGGQHILDTIIRLIVRLIEKEGKSNQICGVGIGTPGFVDEDGTVIGGAENLPGWKGTQLLAPVRKRFGLPAAAANDVTAMALAEARFGAGQGVRNMVCLALGTGIGGGIVLDGRLYKGSHGMAGELGHIVVETNGIQCTCGLKGCAERYGSATGIADIARQMAEQTSQVTALVRAVRRNPAKITSKTVYDYVKKQDAVALQVHETASEMLARVCGIICNALSPDRIILGGGVMKAGQVIIDEVVRRLPNHCWEAIADRTEIVCAQLSDNAGVMGAAALVFEEMPH
jgi:glucokinase